MSKGIHGGQLGDLPFTQFDFLQGQGGIIPEARDPKDQSETKKSRKKSYRELGKSQDRENSKIT